MEAVGLLGFVRNGGADGASDSCVEDVLLIVRRLPAKKESRGEAFIGESRFGDAWRDTKVSSSNGPLRRELDRGICTGFFSGVWGSGVGAALDVLDELSEFDRDMLCVSEFAPRLVDTEIGDVCGWLIPLRKGLKSHDGVRRDFMLNDPRGSGGLLDRDRRLVADVVDVTLLCECDEWAERIDD